MAYKELEILQFLDMRKEELPLVLELTQEKGRGG